jgi:PAS domain S-box-containing protein
LIEKLKKVEEKYQDLFNNSIDGIYKSTEEGKFIEVNASLVKMLGYNSAEELLNIDIKTALYFDISDRDMQMNVAYSNFRKSEFYRLRKKDGSEIWVEDHGRNLFDENGKVLYYGGILRDVSEKKKHDDVLDVLLKISKKRLCFFQFKRICSVHSNGIGAHY